MKIEITIKVDDNAITRAYDLEEQSFESKDWNPPVNDMILTASKKYGGEFDIADIAPSPDNIKELLQ